MRLQSEEIQVHAAEMTKLRNLIDEERRSRTSLTLTVTNLNKTLNDNDFLTLFGSTGATGVATATAFPQGKPASQVVKGRPTQPTKEIWIFSTRIAFKP